MIKNKRFKKGNPFKSLSPFRSSSRFLLLGSLAILLTFLFFAAPAFAAQIRVAWDANTEPDLAGYRVYWGAASGSYGTPQSAGLNTAHTITGLTAGLTYYVAVKAFDSSNNESGFSNEVSGVAVEPGSVTIATNPSGLQIVVDGTTYTSPRTFVWSVGSSHTLAVSSPLSGPAGTRYVFSSWSDSGAQSHTITAPSSSATYTANFTTQYSLTTTANPSAGGTLTPAGTNWYNSGQNVSISATGTSGYAFVSWSGSLTGSTNPSTITMNAAKTITANFSSPGVLTVSPGTGLTASGIQGGPFTPSGQTYTLQNTGGTSINWSVSKGQNWLTLSAASGTIAPGATTTVTASMNSTANGLGVGSYADTLTFRNTTNGTGNTTRSVSLSVTTNTFAHSITTAPSGLQVIVDGVAYTTPRTFNWTAGSAHTVSVSSPLGGTNGIRHVFSSWSDGGAQTHSLTAPAVSTTFTAIFNTQYSLTASTTPSNGGNINPEGVTWHNRGQRISVHAAANPGFSFNSWSGHLTGTSNPGDLTMDGPKSVSSFFDLISGKLHPSIGVFRKGSWFFDNNGNGNWDGCEIDSCVEAFGGLLEALPVTGDWTGDGVVKLGIYQNGQWRLDANGDGIWNSCETDSCITSYGGLKGETPVVGDWTGDRITKIGIYRNGQWLLDANGNGRRDDCGQDICANSFGGERGDMPVVGDWTGSGKDLIGIYRNGQWLLDRNGNGVWEGCTTDICFDFVGNGRDDIPIVADWNNTGKDKIGVYRNGQWLLDLNGNGIWEGCDIDVCIENFFGYRRDIPVVAKHPRTN
jgi:hypothetical protein